jgi:hypothetical protein
MTYVFTELRVGVLPERRLTSCSVFRQTDARNLLTVKGLAVCLVVLAAGNVASPTRCV